MAYFLFVLALWLMTAGGEGILEVADIFCFYGIYRLFLQVFYGDRSDFGAVSVVPVFISVLFCF